MSRFARLTVVVVLGASCSSSTPSTPAKGTGGNSSGSGGGAPSSTGGNASSTGGTSFASGGASGMGGGSSANGGSTGSGGQASTGGVSGASGPGGASATGGTSVGTGGAAVVTCMPPSTATGTAATVTVNAAATPMATVGPDFMGVHTSVYDGSMLNPATVDRLKAAGVKSLRYPGGSYGDAYHWETHTASQTRTDDPLSGPPYVAPDTDFGKFIGLLDNIGANAMITVNYGVNPAGTGPGVPEEAAAWVAYANGLPSNTTAIGTDSTGQDWQTVGYWAGLRVATPLPLDDGKNFLRISHAAPVGIKYWEVGNELYGNGYYYGNCGWEPDWHGAYSPLPGPCLARQNNPLLSPATYGMGVKAFAAAMKKADPNVKVGAIVHWPYSEYASWNGAVLPQACASVDFVVNHWYAGSTLNSLLTIGHTDIPSMYRDLRLQLTMASNACGAKGATMPIALTEWGPQTLKDPAPEINAALTPPAPGVRTHTQFPGIFAAETYANLMEQGALTADWLELHSGSTYLTSDDEPSWGYHAAQVATALAGVGDALLPAIVSNAGTLMTTLFPHAARRTDGGINVMLTNISGTTTAAVSVNVTGGTSLACVGTRTAYIPVSTFEDGPVVTEPIFASATGGSVAVTVPPYSTVVVSFPKR